MLCSHPEYKSIDQMPQVPGLQEAIDEIKKMADKGIYKNIKELGITAVSPQGFDGDSTNDCQEQGDRRL